MIRQHTVCTPAIQRLTRFQPGNYILQLGLTLMGTPDQLGKIHTHQQAPVQLSPVHTVSAVNLELYSRTLQDSLSMRPRTRCCKFRHRKQRDRLQHLHSGFLLDTGCTWSLGPLSSTHGGT